LKWPSINSKDENGAGERGIGDLSPTDRRLQMIVEEEDFDLAIGILNLDQNQIN